MRKKPQSSGQRAMVLGIVFPKKMWYNSVESPAVCDPFTKERFCVHIQCGRYCNSFISLKEHGLIKGITEIPDGERAIYPSTISMIILF